MHSSDCTRRDDCSSSPIVSPAWAQLSPSWAQLGRNLNHLGPKSSQLGPSLVPSWTKVVPTWPLGNCFVFFVFYYFMLFVLLFHFLFNRVAHFAGPGKENGASSIAPPRQGHDVKRFPRSWERTDGGTHDDRWQLIEAPPWAKARRIYFAEALVSTIWLASCGMQ